MKKKYIKPELVNIITVRGGKTQAATEVMGQTKIITMGDHVGENFESNIIHTTISGSLHNKVKSDWFKNSGTGSLKIIYTNTPASKQIGPS